MATEQLEASFVDEAVEAAIECLRPIRDEQAWEWAEGHIRFGTADAHLADRPDFRNIGHLDKYPLELVRSLECQKIVNRSGTQSGKTTWLLCGAAYWMETIGTNGMWLLPTTELVDRVPRNRIIPTLVKSHIGVDRKERDGATLKQVTFHGGDTVLRFMLAVEQNLIEAPAALIVVDEPEELESGDFDLLQLAESRFRTFKSRRQLMIAGTPKKPMGSGGIIDHYDSSKRHLPEMKCPRCRKHTVWDFFRDFKWEKAGADDPHYTLVLDGRYATWAECPECGGRVEEEEWPKVFASARWRDLDPDRPLIACGFWKRSFETAFETPRTCIAEYLKTRSNPQLLKAFLNSWLGEVRDDYDEQPDAFTAERAGALLSEPAKGVVPANTLNITVGIDCGSPMSYAVALAWLPGGIPHVFWSQHMASSRHEWEVFRMGLQHLLSMDGITFASGLRMLPSITAIDSGWNTAEIYKLCKEFRMVATKGASTRMSNPTKFSTTGEGVALLVFDHFYWQSVLDGMLSNGKLRVAKNESERFFVHLASERLVQEPDRNGHVVSKYKLIGPRAQNHFRDALNNALMAGVQMGYHETPAEAAPPRGQSQPAGESHREDAGGRGLHARRERSSRVTRTRRIRGSR